MEATLPNPQALRTVLEGLLGRAVTFMRAAPLPEPAAGHAIMAGAYRTADGQLAAVGLTDVPGAAYLGAALVLIPVGTATESATTGELTDDMKENLREVFNVAAQVFNEGGHQHVVLREVVALPGAEVAPDVTALVSAARVRMDFKITVKEYGEGRLTFLV